MLTCKIFVVKQIVNDFHQKCKAVLWHEWYRLKLSTNLYLNTLQYYSKCCTVENLLSCKHQTSIRLVDQKWQQKKRQLFLLSIDHLESHFKKEMSSFRFLDVNIFFFSHSSDCELNIVGLLRCHFGNLRWTFFCDYLRKW